MQETEYVDKPFKPSSEWQEHFYKGCKIDELVKYGFENKDYFKKEDLGNFSLKFLNPTDEELQKANISGIHFSYYKNGYLKKILLCFKVFKFSAKQ